ncbi:Tm-1-like ATP-binding domain-containing protein [Parasulfitobacter algicola]|uniref:Tm-1-like ATP-binding domain-containing protein n=1 Tax=Parasulfitobacter algicola TaxID=2614809 RepID=A0ABX2IMH0_9RHOB|nr:Tm-1-like ATP-binding domain-containing protein [Sulfitobacter algicola]NSX53540.1 Tm-1-like ATP-binding domain-containing protein [Sulfitobacter algicola]
MSVLLLATYETKQEEADYLIAALMALGVAVETCDISLHAGGVQWSPKAKIAGMAQATDRAITQISAKPQTGRRMVVAIGGGTGGQIALRVLQSLPVAMPKVLVTTLPFDPRYIIADSSIILVPTIADLCGLNATTRAALDQAAAITGGLYHASLPTGPVSHTPSIGVTALGVTGPGTDALCARLKTDGQEVTVFHANGFGGAAFTRWAKIGAFKSVIDYTPHELTRCYIAGVHADMPGRFTSMGNLPRVVLPGGVNFIGLGEPDLMPETYRNRPHYSHSPLFTHVQCAEDEMEKCANILGAALKEATAPVRVLIPMGGFSSEDRPDGAIESPGLRHVFADTLETHIPLTRLKGHINDSAVAHAAVDALRDITKD